MLELGSNPGLHPLSGQVRPGSKKARQGPGMSPCGPQACPGDRVHLGSCDSGTAELKEALQSSEEDTLALILAVLCHHVALGF